MEEDLKRAQLNQHLLQGRLDEMEAFLADYGLEWVGESPRSSAEDVGNGNARQPSDIEPPTSPPSQEVVPRGTNQFSHKSNIIL